MSNKNKGKTPFKSFEGRLPNDDHVRLTNDMLTDPVFKSLTPCAMRLYIYMKAWGRGQDTVTYSASMASDIMAEKTFYRARNELIEKGFMHYENKHHNKSPDTFKKSPGEYRFSKGWQY